jgi:anti-sigma factor RsiW
VTGDRDRDLPEDVLSAYLDGELGDSERGRVEEQLAVDAAWRQILADVTHARTAVRALPVRDAPARVWLRVLTNVAEIAEHETGAAQSPADVVALRAPTRSRSPRWGAIGAAAAAVVVGVALATPQHHHTISPNLPSLSDSHAATASMQSDPLSNLAPAAVPVAFHK